MSHEIKYFVRVIIKNVYVIALTPILILFAIVCLVQLFLGLRLLPRCDPIKLVIHRMAPFLEAISEQFP